MNRRVSAVKRLSVRDIVVCYILVLWVYWVEGTESRMPLTSVLRVLHISVSLRNRLDQTEPAVFQHSIEGFPFQIL